MRILGTLALLGATCLSLTACEQVQKAAADVAGLPTDKNILFWTDAQRDKAFRMMDTLAPSNTIEAGDNPRKLEAGNPLPDSFEVAGKPLSISEYMEQQRLAGMVILQDGKIRKEEYRRDFEQDDRWTSFSVANVFM